MVLFSIGIPGRFAEWCDSALVCLAAASGQEAALQTWPPIADMLSYEGIGSVLDEIGRALIACEADHLIIGARQPDTGLWENLARSNTKFLIALEDPRMAVAEMVAETDANPKSVVRAVANSCPLLMQYASVPGALILRAEAAATDPAGTILAIAQHFGIAIDAARAAAVVAKTGAPMWLSGDAELGSVLSAAPRKMLDGALLPYSHWFAGGQLEQITWTRELFYLAADAGRSPIEPLDVSGGSRILIFGPYIQLPAGSWTAQVVLGFSPEAAGFTYLVDAFAGERLAATTFQPSRPGVYTAELTFSLGPPGGKGVEIRVMVMSDDAKGQLGLGHVVLNPLLTQLSTSAQPVADQDLAAVLEL